VQAAGLWKNYDKLQVKSENRSNSAGRTKVKAKNRYMIFKFRLI